LRFSINAGRTLFGAKSDGYATGLVAFVLQMETPRDRIELQRARAWLTRNQNQVDGSWPAYSLNKRRDLSSDVGRFMSDAATAYAVLALTSSRPASTATP